MGWFDKLRKREKAAEGDGRDTAQRDAVGGLNNYADNRLTDSLLNANSMLIEANAALEKSNRSLIETNGKLSESLSVFNSIFLVVTEALEAIIADDETPDNIKSMLSNVMTMMRAGKFDSIH
jgi:hypothetical protein